ncbi:MAG: hypothetical protein R2857_15020 [Vampirovibrionales bacterium]
MPGRSLILYNQGEDEFAEQRWLLDPDAYTIQFSGPVPQPFYATTYPRHGWWLKAPAHSSA